MLQLKVLVVYLSLLVALVLMIVPLPDWAQIYRPNWVALALIAANTDSIGLGVAVLTPSTRHVMANAAAIAGYLTQKPGICLTVSAPGFLNGLTALAHATIYL